MRVGPSPAGLGHTGSFVLGGHLSCPPLPGLRGWRTWHRRRTPIKFSNLKLISFLLNLETWNPFKPRGCRSPHSTVFLPLRAETEGLSVSAPQLTKGQVSHVLSPLRNRGSNRSPVQFFLEQVCLWDLPDNTPQKRCSLPPNHSGVFGTAGGGGIKP